MRNPAPPTAAGLHAHVLDALGQDIVDGRLSAGTTIDPVEVGARFAVSRSVVREALRVLQSLGLVASRQRIGTQVLPRSSWELMAPSVIRWRGASPGYYEQQRELLELRLGLEPVAAAQTASRVAATRDANRVAAGLLTPAATGTDTGPAEAILRAARDMSDAVEARDGAAYLEADIRFHRALLGGSGNSVLAHFATTVEALLRTRTSEHRGTISEYTPLAARQHLAVAEAVAAGDPARAEEAAETVIRTTLAEFLRVADRS